MLCLRWGRRRCYNLVSEYEKLSLGEALDWCARRAGINLQRKKDPDEEKLSREREALQNAILAAADYYQSKLPLIQEYLKTRGYTPTDEVVKDFALGYSPDFNDLKNTLLAARLVRATTDRCGSISCREVWFL